MNGLCNRDASTRVADGVMKRHHTSTLQPQSKRRTATSEGIRTSGFVSSVCVSQLSVAVSPSLGGTVSDQNVCAKWHRWCVVRWKVEGIWGDLGLQWMLVFAKRCAVIRRAPLCNRLNGERGAGGLADVSERVCWGGAAEAELGMCKTRALIMNLCGWVMASPVCRFKTLVGFVCFCLLSHCFSSRHTCWCI